MGKYHVAKTTLPLVGRGAICTCVGVSNYGQVLILENRQICLKSFVQGCRFATIFQCKLLEIKNAR